MTSDCTPEPDSVNNVVVSSVSGGVTSDGQTSVGNNVAGRDTIETSTEAITINIGPRLTINLPLHVPLPRELSSLVDGHVGLLSTEVLDHLVKKLESIKSGPKTSTNAVMISLIAEVVEYLQRLGESNLFPIGHPASAGEPRHYDTDNIVGFVPLVDWKTRKEGTYLRPIEGESMMRAGIHSGDVGVFTKRKELRDGDIVDAFVVKDEGNTVKRFRRDAEQGYIWLVPENPDFSARRFWHEDVAILGTLVEVIPGASVSRDALRCLLDS